MKKEWRKSGRLIGEMEFVHPVTFVEGKYEPERFLCKWQRGWKRSRKAGKDVLAGDRLRMEEAARSCC